MKSTFTWKLHDGREARIEAEYVCEMEDKIVNADGDKVCVGKEPTTAGRTNMILYVEGKKIDSCRDSNFWRLINSSKVGVKKIWGLPTGFTQESGLISKYESWLDALIDGGTTEEVKTYRAEQKRKERAEEIERAKKLIAKAEQQETIPSKKEAERMMKRYNDINNEGGYGYVPHIISIEEYNWALKVVSDSTTED